MNILVVSDGSQDSQSALTYGIGRALDTHGKLTIAHVHKRQEVRSEKALQDSLRCFDLVRASVHDHGCGIPASAVFMSITDHRDILTYATNAQIDLIVAPPVFDELICSACCLVDIVSADEMQTIVQ
ncbi:MAG TPA: universal stress protein [Nitrospirota bacterium]|nr:universal stress protein [Nitrospirota bacterium]